jgi:hypothetical protein
LLSPGVVRHAGRHEERHAITNVPLKTEESKATLPLP